MSSPQAELLRRPLRWVVPWALLALAPKCGLCLLAYAGLGSLVGLGGVELCGTTPEAPLGALAWLLTVMSVAGFTLTRRWRRPRLSTTCPAK